MKNFIEIGRTEEEQSEQIKKWIKENTIQIVVGIILGITGIWGFDYYQQKQQKQSLEARSYYLSIINNSNNNKTFDLLKEKYANSAYTQQAGLIMAKQAVKSGDYQGALDYLLPLITSEDEFIAHNAKLRSAHIYSEMGNADKALLVLENNTNKAFDALYNNAKGDIYFMQNKVNDAKKYYQLSLSKLPGNSQLRNLIQVKLNDMN